ncbi:MAG: glycosyltransferase family 2 protein [Patescibacteria group bacterium]
MKKISFILPIFNEENNIPKLWEELINLEKYLKNTYSMEYIFVNDSSSDNSIEVLKGLFIKNRDKVVIRSFSRNYGHQIAVSAGQEVATGDAVIIMDTDLQDPPMVCVELIEKWEEGNDIVYAQRRKYKTNFQKEFSAFIFYRLLDKISSVKIPVDTGDFRLISKRVNDEMIKYKEKAKFLRGISSLIGFKQTAVQFDRSDRFGGKPAYTFTKSLKLAIDGLTGFSNVPIRLISTLGFLLAAASFILGTSYVIYAFLTQTRASGWASLIIIITFLGGFQMLMLGILGEYIARIHTQVLDRPLYTVDFDLNRENNSILTSTNSIIKVE